MNTVESFDPSVYLTPPRVDASSGLALLHSLVAAAPHCPGPGVQKALELIKQAAAETQDIWTKRDVVAKKENPRPIDAEVDTAWGALHGRLSSFARLPAERFPKAARAAELDELLFPGGSTAFLVLPYDQEWAESHKRLSRIDAEKLAAEIDELAGPEFLTEIRRAHARYGDVLGITRAMPKEEEQDKNLLDATRNMQRAMANYSVQVLAAFDVYTAEGVASVKAALQPLAAYRAAVSTPRKTAEVPAPAPAPVNPTK